MKEQMEFANLTKICNAVPDVVISGKWSWVHGGVPKCRISRHVNAYVCTSETVFTGNVIILSLLNRRLIFDISTLCPNVPPTYKHFIWRSSFNSKDAKKS